MALTASRYIAMKKTLGASIAASLLLGGVAFADAQKAQVCHETSAENNSVVVIEVAEKALDAHLAHGDTLAESGTCGGGGGDPN